MKGASYIKNGFLYIGYVGNPKGLLDFINTLIEEEGRYEILDEELYETN